MEHRSAGCCIIEDSSRFSETRHETVEASVRFASLSLRKDSVALIRGVNEDEADAIMFEVAEQFGLSDQLEIQAGFAEFRGHRKRSSRYFMTVNERRHYQFIPPHSEGTSSVGMQLAALYCIENTTDGGESILMNVNSESAEWDRLREVAYRGIARQGPLTREASLRARAMFGLESSAERLDDEQVLSPVESGIEGLDVYRVLAKPKRVRCKILDRDLFAYWDSIASYDFDSGEAYLNLLRTEGLLKNSEPELGIDSLDNAYERRVWRSGVDYPSLFRCKLTIKLAPRDLVIQNNVTWTHSTCNWTPESGVRQVVVAFA